MTTWLSHQGELPGLPFDDRAWQFGDGVFETIAVRGGQLRHRDLHIERTLIACRRLGIPAPDDSVLENAIDAAVNATDIDLDFAILKLVITAGQTPRGYRRASDRAANVYTGLFDASPLPASCYTEGVRVRLCNTQLARQPQLAGIKTLNRLEQVLARNEWHDPDVFEGLCFDTDGFLICGTMSNVFVVENKSLVTPDLSHAGVAGVMRRVVIDTASGAGIDCKVRPLRRDELADASEAFLTNSQFGLLPIRLLSDRTLTVSETTRSLMRSLKDRGMREIAC